METDFDKETYNQCPVCGQNTFRYDPDLGANRCADELCRWNDKIGTACDVPMSFLQYCFTHAKSGAHKEYIKQVIQETEKLAGNVS